jgi:hypothetical protein
MSKVTSRKVIINKDGSLALDLSDEQTRRSIIESMSDKNDDRIASLQEKLQRLQNDKANSDNYAY